MFVHDHDTGCHFVSEGLFALTPAGKDDATVVKVTGSSGAVHYLPVARMTLTEGPAMPEGVDPALFVKALVLAREAMANSHLEAIAARLFVCRLLVRLEGVRLTEAKAAAEAAFELREKYLAEPLWQRHYETATAAELMKLFGGRTEDDQTPLDRERFREFGFVDGPGDELRSKFNGHRQQLRLDCFGVLRYDGRRVPSPATVTELAGLMSALEIPDERSE